MEQLALSRQSQVQPSEEELRAATMARAFVIRQGIRQGIRQPPPAVIFLAIMFGMYVGHLRTGSSPFQRRRWEYEASLVEQQQQQQQQQMQMQWTRRRHRRHSIRSRLLVLWVAGHTIVCAT